MKFRYISSFLRDTHIVCSYSRGYRNVGGKQWGKQSYLATLREDVREAHTILAYCFTDSLFSLLNRPVIHTYIHTYTYVYLYVCLYVYVCMYLLKTSRTTKSVLGCLKIPLTSVCVDRLASCENIVSRFQASSIVPPPWRNSTTASAEEFCFSFCSEHS